MTKRQRFEHKLGNAIRARRSVWQNTPGGYRFCPQESAEARVKRWQFRLKQLVMHSVVPWAG